MSRYFVGLNHYFGTWRNGVITLSWGTLIGFVLWKFFAWGVLNSVVWGSIEECKASSGACWFYVLENRYSLLFGTFPRDQLWRAYLALALIWGHFVMIGLPLGRLRIFTAGSMVCVLPFLVGILLYGGFMGLSVIPSLYWGGLLLNTVIFAYTIIFMMPVGVFLALGRRSGLPTVSFLSRFIIETFRGVPMVTLLFFSTVVLPMLLPTGWQGGKLTRVVIILSVFAGCYAAEIIRGGIQALPKGQFEASYALGLGYWKTMAYVILPQAMQIGFPGFVNMAIGLLKDSTLVLTIGMMDLLNMMLVTNSSPHWVPYFFEGAITVSFLFWAQCFILSQVSRYWEGRMEVKR